MLKTVVCVSPHPEDLADGRTVSSGGSADNVDIAAEANARLIRERRLLIPGVADSDIDNLLAEAKAAEAKPSRSRRKTTTDEEASE